MEACGSAHLWARQALRLGHRAVLMNPRFVVPYVSSNMNDVNDADAIAEASSRPGMHCVGIKSVEQQHIQQCTAPGFLDTGLGYAAWRSSYSSRASSGVR